MDLKKRHKIILGLLAEEAATFETLVQKSGYAEGTVKKAIEDLVEAEEIDDVSEEDDPTVYFILSIETGEPSPTKTEEWDQHGRLPHLRKMNHLEVQEGDGFTFHNKTFLVESVIEQRLIAGKPFLKMLATNGIKNFEFTVNLDRDKAPISFKEL